MPVDLGKRLPGRHRYAACGCTGDISNQTSHFPSISWKIPRRNLDKFQTFHGLGKKTIFSSTHDTTYTWIGCKFLKLLPNRTLGSAKIQWYHKSKLLRYPGRKHCRGQQPNQLNCPIKWKDLVPHFKKITVSSTFCCCVLAH